MRALAILLTVLLAAGTAFGATLRLQPGPAQGKDAAVLQIEPNKNYGAYEYLMNHPASGVLRALIEFTGLSAIPKGSTITSANLSFYTQTTTNDNFQVCRITGPWSESTVTWNTKPRYSGVYAQFQIARAGWYSVNVRTLVNEWVQGTQNNYGFLLKKTNEASTERYPRAPSSDYGTSTYRPYLYVVYTPPSAVGPSSVGKVKALFN